MRADRRSRSSSYSSTDSGSQTTGTWAVRPKLDAGTIWTSLPFLRRSSRRSDDNQSRTLVQSEPVPTLSSDSSKNLTMLEPIQSLAPSRTPSPASEGTFQWIRGDLIGKGSYGRVYWALNVTTADVIAVKQVELPRNPTRQEQEMVEALKFESYTLKDLDHPNIVQFLGFEESVDHLSIFMEYVAGGTIGSCLKAHGRFDDEVTKSFAGQMLEGLEYLHSKGIIHRDIKADNILVETSGVCKISDFGISKQADPDLDGRAHTGMKGTVYWMAPEAIYPKETNGYDAKVDIWSIGCVVQEMWTGRRPWYGMEIFPVMMKLTQEKKPPPLPVDTLLSDEAMDFREQCFAPKPEGRPSAAALRMHPYLVMYSGWMFDKSCIEGPAPTDLENEPSIRRAKSHTHISTHRRSKVIKKELPPVPKVPPIPSGPPPLPHHTNSSLPSPSAPPGPPIIFITPPSSPMRSTSLLPPEDGVSSPSTSTSSRRSARRQRSFHVANPDPEDDQISRTIRRPFIYNPPPLPDLPSSSSIGSRLSTQFRLGPRRVPSTPVMRTQSPQSLRSKHASSADTTTVFHSDSDDDTSTGFSVWQRAPSTSKEPIQAAPIPVASGKRDSAWARPFVDDIYEHLQEYFPDHDIDKPIVEEGQGAPSAYLRDERGGTLRPKKSIRMVAEQQGKRSVRKSRRATKLWGSHLEELGGTKH